MRVSVDDPRDDRPPLDVHDVRVGSDEVAPRPLRALADVDDLLAPDGDDGRRSAVTARGDPGVPEDRVRGSPRAFHSAAKALICAACSS